MARVLSGAVAAAVWLVLTGCGAEKNNSTPLAGEKLKTAETEGQKQNPQQASPKASCDLLANSLASEQGWFSVKRGKEDLQARNVPLSAELIAVLKGRDNSFDPSRQCVQLLKKGNTAMVEIVAESCGKDGVIGEERSGAIRLNIGKLLPSAQTLAGDKGKQQPLCTSSRYELSNTPSKGGDQILGELLVNLHTKMVPGEQPKQAQTQSQKSKVEPVMIAQHSFSFALTRLETVKPKVLETPVQKVEQKAPGKSEPQKPKAEPQAPVKVEPQAPVKVEPQKPKAEPQAPVKVEPQKPKAEPQAPVKVEPQKPKTEPQAPVKVEPQKPKTEPQAPVKVEPQKPVQQAEPLQKQKPAPVVPQNPQKPKP